MNLKSSIALPLFLLIFSFFLAEIHPQNRPAFPRIEPDPKALEYYSIGAQNAYSWRALAEISLWASGNSTPANIDRISSVVTALLNSAALPSLPAERAEFILAYMHANILRTYLKHQTRVDTIFTHASYNCVSSAVLYVILCEAAGLSTSGVITKEHAFVIVHIDGQDIDVETTNRFGFDPGNRKEFHDQFGRLTGFTYVPAQNYRDRQTISKIELISLIMNNRISDLERANRYADAVPISIDRGTLLLGNSLAAASESNSSGLLFENPRKEIIDRLINYGTTLLRANREEDSLLWASAASLKYPDKTRWDEYTMAAVNNRISRFLRDRRITEARNFLENNKSYLSDANYNQLDIIVIDAYLLSRANACTTIAEGDAIIYNINQTLKNGKTTESRANELIIFTIQKTAAALCAPPARDWREAVIYLEVAISLFGEHRELEQALRTYRGNLATDYHNRFAAEWNRRNYEEAERILMEGLAEFPDNRQLLNNLETVNRHKAR